MEPNRTQTPEARGAVRCAKQREWGAFLATSSALLLTAGSAIVLASELRLIPGLDYLGLGERFAALGERGTSLSSGPAVSPRCGR